MNSILKNKIKHFSQLYKEWDILKKKIDSKKKITIKKNCPICNSNRNLEIIFTKKSLNFVKCKCYNSNHIFINPTIKSKILNEHFKKSISWKTWAKKVLIKNQNSDYEKRKYLDSIKIIKKFTNKKNLNVLDIGCSTGNFLKYCENNFDWNLFGIEPSTESYKVAKKLCSNNIKITNCNFENFKSKIKFDLVTFWASLEYIQDVNKALLKINKITKKGSILLVFVSGNSNSLVMRILRDKCVGFIFNRSHYFNPKSLRIFLKKFRFNELYKKSYNPELDVVKNFINYNNPYERSAIKKKTNLFNNNLFKSLKKITRDQIMGYKFLAIFKKV